VVGLIVGGGAVAGAYMATVALKPQPIRMTGFLASIASVVVAIHVAHVPSRDLASILAMVMHQQTSICRPADRQLTLRFPDRWSAPAAAGQMEEASIASDADYPGYSYSTPLPDEGAPSTEDN
jgi:hypothetical protein